MRRCALAPCRILKVSFGRGSGRTEFKMKKDFVLKLTSLGLALLCGASFALSACGGKGNGKTETTEDPSTEIITAAPNRDTDGPDVPVETLPLEDDTVREPVDNPRAAMMVKYYYDLAMQVYNWIYVECMPITIDGGVERDGYTYYPIVAVFETALLDGATIETYKDLTDYIYAIFDKPIADILVADSKENYRDINGTLYAKAIDADAQEDGSDKDAFLSKYTSDLFRYTIKETKTIDGNTTVVFNDYVYENTAAGWRWTTFPLN